MKPTDMKAQWEKEPTLELAKKAMPSLLKLACLADEIRTSYKASVLSTLGRKSEYAKKASVILAEMDSIE